MHVKGVWPSTCRERAQQMRAIIIAITFLEADRQRSGFPQAGPEHRAGALATRAGGLPAHR